MNYAHLLSVGDTVTITGSNSTPSINGTHVVTALPSANSFQINMAVTGGGTAGTVYREQRNYGTNWWNSDDLTNWTKRDLGSTPDMHTANDADKSWPTWNASSGTTSPEDVKGGGFGQVDEGDFKTTTDRYWVRVYLKQATVNYGWGTVVELYTKPDLFHDFRCEDPVYLEEIWKYTSTSPGSGVSTGRDGHGGAWLSLNMSGGNDGSGDTLLWDANSNTTNFIGNANETWYFGLQDAFSGITLHAYQDDIPDYSNVDLVWQWYSNYFHETENEGWQTLSGLTISGNTVANPTVITTERHHLVTGDSVTISGSNSNPTIDGTHYVTRISDTTFSIPVNVNTTAGTAGHVICNNHITATGKLSGGNVPENWKEDVQGYEPLSHWYLDVRWDLEKVIKTRDNNLDSYWNTYQNVHILQDQPYSDRASLASDRLAKKSAAFGLNSATVANPTVITSSATAGGTTTNHNMVTGDTVLIRGSNTSPSIDGRHTVTAINATTFSIPVNVSTTAGNTGTITAITEPPNKKFLYWVRCYIKSGTPTTVATLRDVKTSNVGVFKYFARGSSPWVVNNCSTINGELATTVFPYCYRYDNSASAGSKFTNFSSEIQSSTSGTDIRISGNTAANPTVVTVDGPSLTISSNTVATPTVVTTSAAHGMSTGDSVVITNSNSNVSINGTFEVTVLSTTTFSIPVNVSTTAGTAGTAVPVTVHGLTTGHKVVITNSNSNPSINGTHTITRISDTTFSIPVNVSTSAGTAGTVTPEKVYAVDNGQVGDAIYFGSEEPFTQLRLNLSDVLSSSSSGHSTITWEYFRGDQHDGLTPANDWDAISNLDLTYDFKTSGLSTVTFQFPAAWRPVQPGIKESNSTDQSFGVTAYYIRARISANSGSPATSAAKIVQGFLGPNTWHQNLEVGTLNKLTSKRHANPRAFGLTFSERTSRGIQRMPITSYELHDHPFEFINKVSVRGLAGAYGVAEDTTSIATYGIVKERILDDSSLTNSSACRAKAQSLLEQLKPTASTSIRECRIQMLAPPFYSFQNRPSIVRAGDLVNVHLPTMDIGQQPWLVYSIATNLSDESGSCTVTLFQDLSSVTEPGSTDRRLIRDLVTRSRETANAVFQPIDKAVTDGIDFLPEGPGRTVGRFHYNDVGTELGIKDTGGSSSINWTNYMRWNFQTYNNHNLRDLDNPVLMRIDHTGVNPDEDGYAEGGAGLVFRARDRRTSGSAYTSDFHPGTDEATLYLKNSDTANEGSGLYLAHRDIFNSGNTYDEFITDTPKINSEVFVGFTGFVDHTTIDASGRFTINLPELDSIPLIFTTLCGAEGIGGTPGRTTEGVCNVYNWTTNATTWQVISNSAQNPTTVYINAVHNLVPGDTVTIAGVSNSTPSINGTHTVTNVSGNSFSINVNVTSGGTGGTVTGPGKYNGAEMQVRLFKRTDQASRKTISSISVANQTSITTDGSLGANGTGIWIEGSNSTPEIDGLYITVDREDNGNGTFTHQIESINTSLFPHTVTGAGNAGTVLRMDHTHDVGDGSAGDVDTFGLGVMYMVVFNSGKNTTGLNTHFSQNHSTH